MNEREQIIKSMEETRKQMAILSDLLTKDQERLEAVQDAGPWKPKQREGYWVVSGDGRIFNCNWDGYAIDRRYQSFGNCFQTELEAKRHAAKMKFMFRRCPEIEPCKDYWTLDRDTSTPFYWFSGGVHYRARVAFGLIFDTKEEAEEWQPLYKFAFLGGDCPEGF